MPTLNWTLVSFGAIGGLLPDLVRFVRNRQKGFPDWFKKLGYWVALVCLVALGGLVAWLGGAGTWKAALAMGYAAPEIITKLASNDSPDLRGRRDGRFDVRRWWAR